MKKKIKRTNLHFILMHSIQFFNIQEQLPVLLGY